VDDFGFSSCSSGKRGLGRSTLSTLVKSMSSMSSWCNASGGLSLLDVHGEVCLRLRFSCYVMAALWGCSSPNKSWSN
jgi:hypothetical protein